MECQIVLPYPYPYPYRLSKPWCYQRIPQCDKVVPATSLDIGSTSGAKHEDAHHSSTRLQVLKDGRGSLHWQASLAVHLLNNTHGKRNWIRTGVKQHSHSSSFPKSYSNPKTARESMALRDDVARGNVLPIPPYNTVL
jgi:hypothetical protein